MLALAIQILPRANNNDWQIKFKVIGAVAWAHERCTIDAPPWAFFFFGDQYLRTNKNGVFSRMLYVLFRMRRVLSPQRNQASSWPVVSYMGATGLITIIGSDDEE